MPHLFTVSPDFGPREMPAWYVFNTWLQKAIGENIRLELFDSFEAQRQAIAADRVDLIYANPYDAAMLIREKGFLPVASPVSGSDETVVAVPAESPCQRVTDLKPGTRIVSTDDPDVHMMGMILLEPADLNAGNVSLSIRDGYVLVAKELLQGNADVGFFLEKAYGQLSSVVRNGLRQLTRSYIHVVRHALMVGPSLAHRHADLVAAVTGMAADERSATVLAGLGFSSFEPLEREAAEFMIDLVDTLTVRSA